MSTNTKEKNILYSDTLGTDIIRKLNQYAELPKTGFLAGGAVANTILSMEWDGEYPINDLDIFRIESTDGLESRKMPHRDTRMNLIAAYWGVIIISRFGRSYTVSKTEAKGILNFVDVQLDRDHQKMQNYRIIMEGFDLNCCQVGLDLESAELIYSPNFEAFLKTMQLQVSHPCTPFHTAVRIAKKKKELQCYCNDEVQFQYLSQIPLILSPAKQGNSAEKQIPSPVHYAMYFGEKHYGIYKQHKEDLDRYFEVIPGGKIASGGFRYTMIPRNSEIIEELKDCHSLTSIKVGWDLLQHKKSVRDKNIRAWKFGGSPKRFLMANPNYAQCDWHEKHAQQIEEFLEQHSYMAAVFDLFELNIQEQITAIRTIKRMADKEGLYVIGLIEEAIWEYLRHGDPSKLPPDNAITEGWIKSLMDGYLAKNSGLLKEPEDMADFEFAHYFSELITAKDLMSEGIRMHHCVGGYAEIIKSGESAIFHLEAAGECSTIEISKRIRDGVIVDLDIKQHKGIWNKEPIPFHERRGRDLVNYLKEQLEIKKLPSRDNADLLRRFRNIYGIGREEGMIEKVANSGCL